MPGFQGFHRFDIIMVVQDHRDVVPLSGNFPIDHRVTACLHDFGVHAFVLQEVMQ